MIPDFINIRRRKYFVLAAGVVLFILSFVFNTLYSNRSSVLHETKLAEKYITGQHADFEKLTGDTALIKQLLDKTESLAALDHLALKKYGLFLYTRGPFDRMDMRFWSEQLIIPPSDMVTAGDDEFFLELANGTYYGIRRQLNGLAEDGTAVIAFGLIPIQSDFFIETDYLPKHFFFSPTADRSVQISQTANGFPVRTASGQELFYLEQKKFGAVSYNNRTTLVLRYCGVLFFLFFLQLLADSVFRRKGVVPAIALLAGGLVLFRAITYFYPALLNFRQFEFFSPQIYGSNAIQRSLGDLLMNAVLFCWIMLFAWDKLKYKKDMLSGFSSRWRWAVGIASMALLIAATFILASVIRSLIADSKISFDVTDFFSLDRHTVAGFVVLACLSLAYYYLSRLLFRLIFPLFEGKWFLIYILIGLIGLIYLTFWSGRSEVLFYIPVLAWLIVYTWLAGREGAVLNSVRINITGILTWIFIFSVSIAAILLTENEKVEWDKRKRMADKLAEQTDPSSERLMSLSMKFLDNDFLAGNFYRFYDADNGKHFRDSIITDNYRGYLNKYDTRLYVYDSSGRPLNNEDLTSYETLNTILNVQSKPTATEGLYYYETSFDKFNYITRRDVADGSGKEKLGYFFIVSNPKNFSSEALFPELFRQFEGVDPENSPIYSYAVYIDRRLVSPPRNYPFATWLNEKEVPNDEFQQKSNGDYDELWYRASNKKVVIIARKKETILETITLFSYIFCSFLFLVGLVQLITFVIKAINNPGSLKKMLEMNIRSQVHSTITFVSVFSFIIIGIATISFFINRYNRSNSDKLSRTMKIMVNEMEKRLSDHSTFDDVIKLYDSVSVTGLQMLVDEVSDIHGVDVNVYDLEGNLQVTSEANVYTKGVLSKKMDPLAYYYLDRLRHIQHSQEESVGNFSFLSIYSPVRDERGQVYAYINIPYFTSKSELRQEISNFLVTIINLNAFIFLVAGLIALFITNRITRSFSIITDKMKEVNLGKRNEAIAWSRNDEIGGLVAEYNTMVGKLEESATALAKSEREGAWREMARQVAHEIKNPLTPMKLSIQYLQNAIDDNKPNVKELSSSVAATLVEQIDHLSKIAADFSQFANISNTKVELFDLHEVLYHLKELFSTNEKVDMTWKAVYGTLMIEADKTQMNRLFTNLFTNAIQACDDEDVCKIEIAEKRNRDQTVQISIRDYGQGISEEMQQRIFMPNFTTKSSGTGLGLAMCKSIVEQAHGRIWFETEQGKGTVFYVELPLVE